MDGRRIDPPASSTLGYVRSIPKDEPCRNIELLPDEKADLHSINYIYRAVLAQVKKELQQAMPEG